MSPLNVLKTLLRIGNFITLLGNFLVKVSSVSIDTNLVSKIQKNRDQLDLLQDSLTLSKGDENETPDDPQRVNSKDRIG